MLKYAFLLKNNDIPELLFIISYLSVIYQTYYNFVNSIFNYI